jgi:hypothetical protein
VGGEEKSEEGKERCSSPSSLGKKFVGRMAAVFGQAWGLANQVVLWRLTARCVGWAERSTIEWFMDQLFFALPLQGRTNKVGRTGRMRLAKVGWCYSVYCYPPKRGLMVCAEKGVLLFQTFSKDILEVTPYYYIKLTRSITSHQGKQHWNSLPSARCRGVRQTLFLR